MFSSGPAYTKLKTNLRLAINRFKLLEKKKTELTQKARKEIADYISGHKEDRARIRVENIIREDYLVEAYELLEMFCDLLLARFGLIQQMKTLDEGIEEAVNSVIWAAPRLQADVQELKIISDQLTAKYGKPFAEACRQNQLGKVNPKLMAKLNVHAPPKILVEKYMIEIAKSHGVPFTPDENVMREDEISAAEAMLVDFQNQGQQGYGWMYPPTNNTNFQQPPGDGNAGGGGYPPPGGAGGYPPPGNQGGGGGGGGIAMQYQQPQYQQQQPPQPNQAQPFSYPQIKKASPTEEYKQPPHDYTVKVPLNEDPMGLPSAPSALPELPDPPTLDMDGPPSYNTSTKGSTGKGSGTGDDLDFDDLSRRFEELKKKR